MIRVLQYISGFDFGGIESMIMNIYDHLDTDKVQFDFLVEKKIDKEIEDKLRKKGANVFYITKMTEKNGILKQVNEIKEILKKNNYKILHWHGTYTRPCVPIVSRLKGVSNIIFHVHSTGEENTKHIFLRRVLKKLSIILSNHYFACSLDAAQFYFGRKKSKKAVIINNAIDFEKYRYDINVRNKIRKQLNLDNELVIGHVGRFVEVKNHKFIINVFNELKKLIPSVKLLLVGDGELLKDIKKQAEELKLKKDVIFTGVTNNVEEILQAMDVFIFPSFFEGLGMVGIEAQAAGLKVLASENIPRNMKITELVEFIDLNKGVQWWVDKIIKIKDYKRRDMYEEVMNSGYYIKDMVKHLEDFYLTLM